MMDRVFRVVHVIRLPLWTFGAGYWSYELWRWDPPGTTALLVILGIIGAALLYQRRLDRRMQQLFDSLPALAESFRAMQGAMAQVGLAIDPRPTLRSIASIGRRFGMRFEAEQHFWTRLATQLAVASGSVSPNHATVRVDYVNRNYSIRIEREDMQAIRYTAHSDDERAQELVESLNVVVEWYKITFSTSARDGDHWLEHPDHGWMAIGEGDTIQQTERVRRDLIEDTPVFASVLQRVAMRIGAAIRPRSPVTVSLYPGGPTQEVSEEEERQMLDSFFSRSAGIAVPSPSLHASGQAVNLNRADFQMFTPEMVEQMRSRLPYEPIDPSDPKRWRELVERIERGEVAPQTAAQQTAAYEAWDLAQPVYVEDNLEGYNEAGHDFDQDATGGGTIDELLRENEEVMGGIRGEKLEGITIDDLGRIPQYVGTGYERPWIRDPMLGRVRPIGSMGGLEIFETVPGEEVSGTGYERSPSSSPALRAFDDMRIRAEIEDDVVVEAVTEEGWTLRLEGVGDPRMGNHLRAAIEERLRAAVDNREMARFLGTTDA